MIYVISACFAGKMDIAPILDLNKIQANLLFYKIYMVKIKYCYYSKS